MNIPVDLNNLRSMTDGDVEMERALFSEFYSSFEQEMATMGSSCSAQAAEAWRSSAHALKGVALNLGAERLSDLCKHAQDEAGLDEQAKAALLAEIVAEYDVVKDFLKKV